MARGENPRRGEMLSQIADRGMGPAPGPGMMGPGGPGMGGGGAPEMVLQAAQLLIQAAQIDPTIEPAIREAIGALQRGAAALASGGAGMGGPPMGGPPLREGGKRRKRQRFESPEPEGEQM